MLLGLLVNRRQAHGIVLGEHPVDVDRDPQFFDLVGGALDLLRKHDPRRFGRVRRELPTIYSRPMETTAMYLPTVGACAIDLSRAPDAWRRHDTFLHYLAAVIVHEATHGEIRRRSRQRDWTREEPICTREQWRAYETLTRMTGVPVDAQWLAEAREYDPRWHRVYYNTSPLERVRRSLRRVYGGAGVIDSLRRACRGETSATR